jgi:hypothetical protein
MRAMTHTFAALAALAATCGAAEAKTINFTCDNNFSLVYEGDDEGTLSLHGPYGEVSLPASRQERDGMFGIRASGAIKMPMPDKAALEACVTAKAQGETDTDIIYVHINSCAQSLAPAPTPADVKAMVEIAVIEPPDAQVFITREFTEATTLPGGKIEIPSFPMPQCTVDGG